MLPTLRQKLKGWVFKDETAEQLVELSEMIPEEARASQEAFQAFIESKSLWQSQLKEIRQEKNEYHQSIDNSGNIGQQVNTQSGTVNLTINNQYASEQSEQHQAANKTGSPTVKKS